MMAVAGEVPGAGSREGRCSTRAKTRALTHTSDGPFGVAGDLMGQTELFIAVCDRPEFVHELLTIVTTS